MHTQPQLGFVKVKARFWLKAKWKRKKETEEYNGFPSTAFLASFLSWLQ